MLGNVFDPKAELLILSGVRPHWSQAGAVVFITARLHDSIPSTVLQKWEQCDSWLHYTAVQINRRTGTEGKLWQQEPFDHLVRSPEQYEYLRKYIADNAAKARLPGGSFLYRRYPDQ